LEIRPIKHTWALTAAPGARRFEVFFQPILPKLAAFHWFCEPVFPFDRGEGSEDETFAQIDDSALWPIPPGTLLPRFAHFVTNDWADLYGFLQPPDEEVRARLGRGVLDPRRLSAVVDVCFFNVDGAYWEIYARDDQMLSDVARHVGQLPDVSAAEKLLQRRECGM
jgi:hypothetical protein